jgi:CRISPR-associated protein Cmr1
MPWTTLTLQVTTPLFNGGAEAADEDGAGPDGGPGGLASPRRRPVEEPGIRVASVRGAMRFWFRALAGTVAGPDTRLLARMEEAVFGSVAHPSPVALRIRAPQPKVTPSYPTPKWIGEAPRPAGPRPGPGRGGQQNRDDGKWLIYLLGQGLADAKERSLRRDFVDAGKTVSLALRFSGDEAVDTLALASLWLLCTYGGLGSRVRRGWGGLAITAAEGDLPGGWTRETVLTPGLGYFGQQQALWPIEHMDLWQTYLCDLPGVDVTPPESAEAWPADGVPPAYPVLSRTWTRAALWSGNVERDWEHVLGYAGEQFRWFRAEEDTPGVRYRPQVKTRWWMAQPGGDGGQFELGALGLPVVFKKAGPTVHAGKRSAPGAPPVPLRRASPLWLRVVGSGDQWKLFSFAFRGEFLPPGVKVHVWPDNRRPGRELAVTSADVVNRTDQWLDAMKNRTGFIRKPELR